MSIIDRLNEMRQHGGKARTHGLTDEVIQRFAAHDEQLTEEPSAGGVYASRPGVWGLPASRFRGS